MSLPYRSIYVGSFGRPTWDTRFAANPEQKQWCSGYATSWDASKNREWIDVDAGLKYTKNSTWEGGPSVNQALLDHAVENCGWWTNKNGPNKHVGGNEPDKNAAIELTAHGVDKAVYSFGHHQYSTGSANIDQPESKETLCIGLSGNAFPRWRAGYGGDSLNEYDNIGLRAVYLHLCTNHGQNKWPNLKDNLNKLIDLVKCINDGGTVATCYNNSQFSSLSEKRQRRSIGTDLVEEYMLESGTHFNSNLRPNASVLECLEELITTIGSDLPAVYQRLQTFKTRAFTIIDLYLGTINNSAGQYGSFIARLEPTPESTFQFNRYSWGATNPGNQNKFISGLVSEFAQRFISFGCLSPNGGLYIAGCDSLGILSHVRILDLWDWQPIWAPNGVHGRELNTTTDGYGRKVYRKYDRTEKIGGGWYNVDHYTKWRISL